jgi:hypothetical protein
MVFLSVTGFLPENEDARYEIRYRKEKCPLETVREN